MKHQRTDETAIADEERISIVKLVLLLGFFFVACFIAGSVHFYFHHRFVGLAQLSAFFFLGLAYWFITDKKLGVATEILLYTLLGAVLLVIFLTAFHIFKEDLQFAQSLSFGSAFLLPVVIAESWKAFERSSYKTYYPWFYSKDIPEETSLTYFEKMPVRIRMIIEKDKRVTITETFPSSLKLGTALFYSIRKNAKQEGEDWRNLFIKPDGQPYEWQFISKSFRGTKSLDPAETVHETAIKPNTLIVAKRFD